MDSAEDDDRGDSVRFHPKKKTSPKDAEERYYGYSMNQEESDDEMRGESMSPPIPEDERIHLSWKNLSVSTKTRSPKQEPKKILQHADGIVHSGSLMALMGASGAGKTTLLNVLNFRSTGGLKIEGSIMLNGHKVDQNLMSKTSVFVQQQDVFVGTLKVKEHLMFHATLRMKWANKKERKARVETIMREMGLKKCENVLIGVTGKIKGISGGEAKRLAFATEILTKPTLIFCDEPTSGLDSFMARNLVKLLKRYASNGRTILCTIHQPSSETFELFDHICIMAEGKCAFIGSKEECSQAFGKAGYPVPPNYNPSDHFIFTLAVIPGSEEECRAKVAALTEAYQSSPQCSALNDEIDALESSPQSDGYTRNIRKTTCCEETCNLFQQFHMIIYRSFMNTLRDPSAFFIRLILITITSFLVGLLWYKVNFKKASSQQNVPGIIFYVSTVIAFSSTATLTVVVPNELAVIERDYLSRVYKIPMYYFAVAAFYTIEVLINTLIIINIVWWMVFTNTELDAVGAFPIVLLVYVMMAIISIAFGLVISSMSNSFLMATSMTGPMLTTLMLFSGFLIPTSIVPDVFIWIEYISYFYYAFSIIMVEVYKGMPRLCTEPGPNFIKVLPKLEPEFIKKKMNVGKVKNYLKELCTYKQACDNFLTGDAILDRFSVEDNRTRDFIALVGILIVLHILGFTILTTKMWCKRKK